MTAASARHTVLSEISPFDHKSKGNPEKDDLRIVVETPRGSRAKYSYDPDCDCMELSTVLPEGMVFPYDFGFVPGTLGEDGDPIDVLILMDASVVPGCVVRARLIGAIEAEQKDNGKWVRNDRLIAVATHAQTYDEARKLSDLRPHLVREIKQFFANYNELRDRRFRARAEAGPNKAKALVKQGLKRFQSKSAKKK
ncbi:MAG TPA: inorganic diphosphatase [Xanthobacteraceae bacterium]|nr:inorganic diphosphatase [Xanthobacteraceae bacterium]